MGRPSSCSCGNCGTCLNGAYLKAWYAGQTVEWYASLTDEQLAALRAYRAKHGRKNDAKRAGTEKRRASLNASTRRQRAANPAKYKASTAVGNAIRDKRLVKGTCEVCGSERVEAHHDDYSRPLDVRWFCRPHHRAHHGHLRPDYPLPEGSREEQ